MKLFFKWKILSDCIELRFLNGVLNSTENFPIFLIEILRWFDENFSIFTAGVVSEISIEILREDWDRQVVVLEESEDFWGVEKWGDKGAIWEFEDFRGGIVEFGEVFDWTHRGLHYHYGDDPGLVEADHDDVGEEEGNEEVLLLFGPASPAIVVDWATWEF